MNIKTDCLGKTAMPFDDVEYFAKFAYTFTRNDIKQWAKKIALSHERLRAERDGLQIMYDELDHKVQQVESVYANPETPDAR